MTVSSDANHTTKSYRPHIVWAAVTDGSRYLLILIFFAGLAHGIYYLLLGIASPLLDFFSFRQTQTALSAYWIWRGGPWLAYETPVLGYPWTIPIEVPIYQWLIAALRMAGVPIDIGGRLLSFGFYLGCLWPMWSFFRTIKLPHTAFLATGALFLWSPIYIYWGRTVMIESCALFFCLLWLALVGRFLKVASVGSFVGAIFAGLTGVLCKGTTFPAVVALAGILVLADAYRTWAEGSLVNRLRIYALTVAIVIVPLTVEIAWMAYSDTIRLQNPFGGPLVAFSWVYGTWQQRVSSTLWRIIFDRSLSEIFGSATIALMIVAGIGLLSGRYTVPILAALLAFMIPFLVFTNLHIVHNYYQTANAIFALAAIGIAIGAIAEAQQPVLAPLLLAVFVSSQIYFFHHHYASVIAADFSNDRILRISLLAREKTQPADSLIVIGQDWSSAVAYYSERKTLTIPGWAPTALTQKVFENPQTFLNGSPLGGIVICPESAGETLTDLNKHYVTPMPLIAAFIADHAIIGEVQGCRLLAPDRSRSER